MLISAAARRLKFWINIPCNVDSRDMDQKKKIGYNSIGVNLKYNT